MGVHHEPRKMEKAKKENTKHNQSDKNPLLDEIQVPYKQRKKIYVEKTKINHIQSDINSLLNETEVLHIPRKMANMKKENKTHKSIKNSLLDKIEVPHNP